MKNIKNSFSFNLKNSASTFFFCALFFFSFTGYQLILGQNPNWSSFLTVSAYPSPYLSQWERDPSIGTLTLNYNGNAPVEFYFSVEITHPNYGTVISGTTPDFSFAFGPTSRVFTFQDVVDWGGVRINNQVELLIQQTGMLPEGEYEACVQTLSRAGELLTESCYSFEIIQPGPPELVSPINEDIVYIAQPTFIWNQVIVPPTFTDIYRVKIVEVLDGQTLYRAIESNIPVFEEEITQMNSMTYPVDAYPLEMNKTYAWRVTAINEEGAPIAKNMGKSDIWSFFLGGGGGEFGLETLTLIEETAFLVDMQNISVTDDGATITLDGDASMRLEFGDGSTGLIPVNVNGLILQKDNYENPVFLGGGVTGDLVNENIFRKDLVGDYFSPSSIEFDYTGVLKIRGGFVYQGNPAIPFPGEITMDAFGLFGELLLSANPGETLFVLGNETIGAGITEVALSFPSKEIRLNGNALLFNQLSDCEIEEITIEEDGNTILNLNCETAAQFPLLDGSNLFTLRIDFINGNITTNLINAGISDSYDVNIFGKMTFNFNPESLFGLEVDLNLLPGKINVVRTRPFGDYENSAIDLGWVNFLIEDLELKKINYENGLWNFKLTMGANFFFPDLFTTPLPRLTGVSLTPRGFWFPMMKLSGAGVELIDFEGFALEVEEVRSERFSFDFGSWTPGKAAEMNFEFDVLFNMPNLPFGSSDQLTNLNRRYTAKFNSGNFSLEIPEFSFQNNDVSIPLNGNINFYVKKLGGKLNAEYDGSMMNFLPDIKVKGDLDMPESFTCDNGLPPSAQIASAVNISGFGMITGTATDAAPNCPLDLGFISVMIDKTNFEFIEENGQKIYLDGTGIIQLGSPDGGKVNAKIRVRYEIMESNLVILEGRIDDPFLWEITPEYPGLTFEIGKATIEQNLLKIDGRHKLLFDGGSELGVTFDKLNISLQDFSIDSGGIIFDSPFAFMISGLDNFELSYKAVPLGTPIKESSGLYIELPENFGMDKRGLYATGNAKAKMVYQNAEFDQLGIEFLNNFAIYASSPLNIISGQIDIYSDRNKIAYVNSDGFFPDPSFFLDADVPERIPLPIEDLAYLQIKENDRLLVNARQIENGIIFSTIEGQPVPLVFPSLQFNMPAPPQVLAEFSFTINSITGMITDGSLQATIPQELFPDFDLSRLGIPFEIKGIYFGEVEGVFQFTLSGIPKLFDEELNCPGETELVLTRDGRLEGEIACDVEQSIPLIPDSDKLTLNLNRFGGNFDVNLLAPIIDFDFELDSDIILKLGEENNYGAWVLLGITPDGMELRDYRLDVDGIGGYIDLGVLQLGIENLSIENIDWDSSPGAGWEFGLSMDMEMYFPTFDLHLPKLNGINLDNSGFHFQDDISIDLSDFDLSIDVQGFNMRPVFFRKSAFDFDWFNSGGEGMDWGFSFDFDVALPGLNGDGIVFPWNDVGLSNGVFVGNVDFAIDLPGLNFALGGDFGLGFNITRISGSLFNDNGSQGINIGLNGFLQLPEFMRCDGQEPNADITQTLFSFDSRGLIVGTVENFVPECPIDLGFGAFAITSSALDFSVVEDRQKVILDMNGELEVPTGGGESVIATGSLTMDLISGEIIDGEISIEGPFVWAIPNADPVLIFEIQRATLNSDGLSINGNNRILFGLNDPTGLPVVFDDFVFDLINFRILRGSVTLSEQMAFELLLENGGLSWSVIGFNAPLIGDNAAKIGFSGGFTLGADGLRVEGAANAEIHFGGEIYSGLRLEYSDDFNFELDPFGVLSGRADIFMNDDLAAWLDNTGLHLGDIFGLVPLPEKIPLPDISVAYLQIKNGDDLLVEFEPVEGGVRIFTIEGEPVSLVLPGLAYGANPPSFNVEFSVTLNTTTWEFMDGEISILPGGNDNFLIDLSDLGIPVKINRIRYARFPQGGDYRLMVDGRFDLPGILDGFAIALNDILVDGDGLSGEVNLGTFSRIYRNDLPNLNEANLGEYADITLEGVNVVFGNNSAFGFSGKLIPGIFNDGNETSRIHYAAEWMRNEGQFVFSFDFPPNESLNLGVAEFFPMRIGDNPPMALTFMENDFSLMLSGELRFADFGNDFSIAFSGLEISMGGVSAPDVRLQRNNAITFGLFGMRFRIFNLQPDPAISFEYENGVFYLTLTGELTFLDRVVEFHGFRIGTDGEFSINGLNLLPEQMELIAGRLVFTEITISDNRLAVSGWAKPPEPVSQDSTFPFDFEITADGRIIGGNEIVILDEPRGLGNIPQTEFDFWVATFDPTYLSVLLNFGDINECSLRMVADVYLNNQQNSPIGIGNRSGGNVNPGLTINFNGDISWTNTTIPGSLGSIEWETLEISLDNLIPVDGSDDFIMSISGSLGINIAGVSGGLGLVDLRVNPDGSVDNLAASIRGGDLTIAGAITVTVNDIGFSDTPTQIEIESGSLPDNNNASVSETVEITVDNYFSFGGSIEVAGIFSGGIDRLLTYSTPNSSNLIIENANVSLPGVASFHLDMTYYNAGNDYYLLTGGSAEVVELYDVIVIGKIGSIGNRPSFGLFVAGDVTIPVLPGVFISQIGGGFFYNPAPSDLLLVKSLCGLESEEKNKIADPGNFAIFFYGEMSIVNPNIISARVLLSMTGRTFA
ncbi:MAG: hypothetical protein GXO87_03510, partial [Chlorobi bacterium]|nr:hypothetical protein [Chlorobiota bacterium]